MAFRYAEAVWKGDGQSGGSYIGVPPKLVVHTTETVGLPSYAGGASAPHITYDPNTRQFTQHTDLNTAARALRNEAGGVETNRANAYQLEVICYSAKHIADQSPSRLWVGDLEDTAYDDIRDLAGFLNIPLVWPGHQALSYAEANAPGFRMAGSDWLDFHGIVGHQHVPENTHWDPGAFDWTRLIGDNMEQVIKDIQRNLNAARFTDKNGNPLLVDGVWGPATKQAHRKLCLAAAEPRGFMKRAKKLFVRKGTTVIIGDPDV